jgi:hypothetical protein
MKKVFQGGEQTKYGQLVELVESALNKLSGSRRAVVKSRDLQEWIERHDPESYEQVLSSWAAYLSRAAADPETRVQRAASGYGYVLGERHSIPPPTPQDGHDGERGAAEDVEPPRMTRAYNQREALLYPPLADWLKSNHYRADITAPSTRGKAWGNPDVAGIKLVEGFVGRKDLELATIEVKKSAAQWRYWFFEAVAHKRFAHRAYFAFGHGSDDPTLKEIAEAAQMREYGERYHVGILVVFMPAEMHERLNGGDIDGWTPDLSDLRIEELWPATFEDVRPAALSTYLQSVLGFDDDRDVYAFGRA